MPAANESKTLILNLPAGQAKPAMQKQIRIEAADVSDLTGKEKECLVGIYGVTATGLLQEPDFEKLLADLSARFVNTPSSRMDFELEDAQGCVCECLGLDLSSLWLWPTENPHSLVLTHLHRPKWIPPAPKRMIADELFPWIQRQVLAGMVVILSSIESLPAEAARDQEAYRQFGIKAALVIPLSTGGGPPFGALAFNDMEKERAWPEALVRRLQLVAQIFANAIARRRSDQVLRESEARLSSAIDAAGLGFYQMSSGLRVDFLDNRCRAFLGLPLSEESRLQEHWLEHVHPDDRPQVLKVSRGILEGGLDKFALEYRYLHPLGGLKWFRHISHVLERNGAGQAARIVGVMQDITEHKNVEEEMNRLRLLLWHSDRVAQTAAVTASLTHELNQPLSAILSNAQAGLRLMAAGNPDLEEIRDILKDIVQDDKRAVAVVSGLRDLLRRRETHREMVSLSETIRWVVKLLSSDLTGKQIQLCLQLEPDVMVSVDKAQIQQVLLNLMLNAIEAMQSKPVGQRQLDLALKDTGAGDALVSICDSGPGISEEQREKIFEVFTTDKQNGLGVGLVISRSIIESHKGRLWFENNSVQGVTFCFTLPLIIEPAPDAPVLMMQASS